jgi:hypothetical protein
MAEDTHRIASRRIVMRAGLGALAAGALRPALAQAPKVPQSAVMYQDQPKDGHKCSDCQHFQPPNACAVVAGTISPDGWCGVWTAKTPA